MATGSRESYVRPPLVAREPPPAWLVTWRFRLVALLLLSVLIVITVLLFRQFISGATAQDPGIGALRAAAPF